LSQPQILSLHFAGGRAVLAFSSTTSTNIDRLFMPTVLFFPLSLSGRCPPPAPLGVFWLAFPSTTGGVSSPHQRYLPIRVSVLLRPSRIVRVVSAIGVFFLNFLRCYLLLIARIFFSSSGDGKTLSLVLLLTTFSSSDKVSPRRIFLSLVIFFPKNTLVLLRTILRSGREEFFFLPSFLLRYRIDDFLGRLHPPPAGWPPISSFPVSDLFLLPDKNTTFSPPPHPPSSPHSARKNSTILPPLSGKSFTPLFCQSPLVSFQGIDDVALKRNPRRSCRPHFYCVSALFSNRPSLLLSRCRI